MLTTVPLLVLVGLVRAVPASHAIVLGRAGSNANSLALDSAAVQSASASDGVVALGSEAFQAPSATSNNNFINFCSGKTLSNGLQITTGSCNGIPMGDIPAKNNMVSSIITNPKTGESIQAETTFNVTVQMSNIVAGSFTNPDVTYFAAPQALEGGNVVGHTHVTIQDLGNSLNPTTALDATKFSFFKGINDAGNGEGLLNAVVTGGLPVGNYRVCTMASASNHQPVIMPVAQRGTADDCTKFSVTGSGSTINIAADDGSKGIAAASLAALAVKAATDPALAASISSSVAAAGTASATDDSGASSAASTTATVSEKKDAKDVKATSAAEAATTSAKKNEGERKSAAKITAQATTEAAAAEAATTSAKKNEGGRKSAAKVTAQATTEAVAGKATTTASAKKSAEGLGSKKGFGGFDGGKGDGIKDVATSTSATSTTSSAPAAMAKSSSGGDGVAASVESLTTPCASMTEAMPTMAAAQGHSHFHGARAGFIRREFII